MSTKLLKLFVVAISIVAAALAENAAVREYPMAVECAPYCLNMFRENIGMLNKKIEVCDEKDKEIGILQNQLAICNLKLPIYEKSIRDKEQQCTHQERVYDQIVGIKYQMKASSAAAQLKINGLYTKLIEMQKQIVGYRSMIEEKDEEIKELQTKLEIIEYTAEEIESNSTLIPAPMRLIEVRQKKRIKKLDPNCLSIETLSDIREIRVPGIEPFKVPCDGTIAGPGWTVIQRRVDDAVDFNRNWTDYRNGFGDLNGSFFVGLEKLFHMSNFQDYELYIHLENFENEFRYAHYQHFAIGSEEEAYQLKVLGEYSGDANDTLVANKLMKFTTFDKDNDNFYANCAQERCGGWWFNQCARSNLNGRYYSKPLDMWDGIWWYDWQETIALKSVHMLIRPVNNDSIIT